MRCFDYRRTNPGCISESPPSFQTEDPCRSIALSTQSDMPQFRASELGLENKDDECLPPLIQRSKSSSFKKSLGSDEEASDEEQSNDKEADDKPEITAQTQFART